MIDALISACEQGNIDVVKSLICEPGLVNAANAYGNTALHRSIIFCQFEIMDILIKAGTDVNAVNNFWETSLHLAVAFGTTVELNKLIAAGGDVGQACRFGDSPLHWAVELYKPEMVYALMEAGASFDSINVRLGHNYIGSLTECFFSN